MTAQPRRPTGIDGEGVAWAVGGFVASLLIGLLVEPFRATVGLENVVICYLLVVVAAISAALAYDFFLTTPYHTLVIDSLAQVITVALLVATGVVVSIGGRVRRRSAVAAEAHADAIRVLHRVTEAAAAGGPVDRVAAEGLQRLLVAHQRPVGYLVVIPGRDVPADRTIRLATGQLQR
jgi:K+-sensing histidine kinase KdpD